MTRRLMWVICALASIAAVTGCAKKGLEGKWTGSSSRGGVTIGIDLSFTRDGKFQQASSVAGGPLSATMVTAGTWVAKETKLTMKPTSATVNGTSIAPPANSSVDFTYKLDGDNLTLGKSSEPTVTLKRVNE